MTNKWTMTNGDITMSLCTVCVQPYREGHRNCDCDQNHPDPCTRPTYSELEAKLVEHEKRAFYNRKALNSGLPR